MMDSWNDQGSIDHMTNADKKKLHRKKRSNDLVISFDPEARRDYLTGFRKRKAERKKEAVKKWEERQRQEKLEMRRMKREHKKKQLEQYEESRRIMLGYEDANDASASLSDGDEEMNSRSLTEEPLTLEAMASGMEPKRSEYRTDENITTVTTSIVDMGQDSEDERDTAMLASLTERIGNNASVAPKTIPTSSATKSGKKKNVKSNGQRRKSSKRRVKSKKRST